MYSPSLENLLKSIKQSTENPAPFKKGTDVQSGLPFKLFPSVNKPNFAKKKIVVIADTNCNIRLVESILTKISKVVGFIVYYHGPNIDTMDAGVAVKLVGEMKSVTETLGPDIIIMFGFVDSFKKFSDAKHYVILEQQNGLLLNTVDLLNKTFDKIYVFSEFYKKTLIEQGIQKPLSVLKLGLDSTIIKQDQNTLRSQMALTKDSFVIVNPRNNRIDLAIMAFTRLISKRQKQKQKQKQKQYPDIPLVLMCITNSKYALDIYKCELMRTGLPVNEHIGKLYLTEKADLAYRVANVGLNTDDSDKIRYDFLEFISYGKPQIVPNYGFYSEYTENNTLVDITGTSYGPNDNSLGVRYGFEPEDLAESLNKYIDNCELNSGFEKVWGSWSDEFIKSLL